MTLENAPPSFNLWFEPWITLERPDGQLEVLSIERVLTEATSYRALFDPSPLVIVSIHRLLVAILQDIIQPEIEEDLYELWEDGEFDAEAIAQFGREYAQRFDLFSAEAPFMQSADMPLYPTKKGKGKSVGYLFQEENAGTAVTHYHHTYDDSHQYCPICCAKGLITIPAFASSGGAGIKPSINGVPPIYVLPGGETLFQSLAASLTVPNYQPTVADTENDTPWWRHRGIVEKKSVVHRVGYLHSLTFPARRVRLRPEKASHPCSRCGREADWTVSEMVFDMGESRPKEAAFWRDPFAAYKIRKDGEEPIPLRPLEGKALWREYEGLFLPTSMQDEKAGFMRPAIINQLEQISDELPYDRGVGYPFRIVGVRTDMKAKTFEWESHGFQVPPDILVNLTTAQKITAAIRFATDIDSILKRTFNAYFGGDGQHKRHETIKKRLSQAYWSALAPEFQQTIIQFAHTVDLDPPFHAWLDTVQQTAMSQFADHAKLVGRDATALKQRVEAINSNRARIFTHRKKNYPRPKLEATT